MVDVSNQRRMAADVLKCGQNRVWMYPDREKLSEISEATTRSQIRQLIARGYIRKLSAKGVSRGRARDAHLQRKKGRQRGPGSRRGTAGARTPPKQEWIANVRRMRRTLASLRDQGRITTAQYRTYYRWAKGGQFHNRAHMLQQMEARGDIPELKGGKPAAGGAKAAAKRDTKTEGTKGGKGAKAGKDTKAAGDAASTSEPESKKRSGLRRRRRGAKEE